MPFSWPQFSARWSPPRVRRLHVCLLGIALVNASLGFDVALMNALLSNQAWFDDLRIPANSTILGPVLASLVFGTLAGTLPGIWCADHFGRRSTMLLSCALQLASIVGQVLSERWYTFLCFRICSGFALGASLLTSSVFINELSPESFRPQFTALSPTCFFIGSISSTWCAYGALGVPTSWSWRGPILIQMLWPCIQGITLYWTPESPSWFIAKERWPEARNVFLEHSIMLEEDVDAYVRRTRQSIIDEKSVGWAALLRRSNRKRLVLIVAMGLGTQWFGNGVISYYLPPILATVGIHNPHQQLGINGGIQAASWVAATTGALLCGKCGRRRLLLGSSVACMLSLTAITAGSALFAQHGQESSGRAVIAAIFIFSTSYSVAYTPLPGLLVTELVPFPMRAKASGLLGGISGAAVCFNQYINPMALESLQWKYYLVFLGVEAFFTATFAVLVPETQGCSLIEASHLLDAD